MRFQADRAHAYYRAARAALSAAPTGAAWSPPTSWAASTARSSDRSRRVSSASSTAGSASPLRRRSPSRSAPTYRVSSPHEGGRPRGGRRDPSRDPARPPDRPGRASAARPGVRPLRLGPGEAPRARPATGRSRARGGGRGGRGRRRSGDSGAGERVVVAHHVPCSVCHYCRRGSVSMCRAFKASNLDPGGFAEYVRVPRENVRHVTFRVPDRDVGRRGLVHRASRLLRPGNPADRSGRGGHGGRGGARRDGLPAPPAGRPARGARRGGGPPAGPAGAARSRWGPRPRWSP